MGMAQTSAIQEQLWLESSKRDVPLDMNMLCNSAAGAAAVHQ